METIFLSEMVAAPIHGGGITLHRIIENELDDFQYFVKTVKYINEPQILWPSSNNFIAFPFGTQSKKLSKIIGSTLPYLFFKNNLVRKIHSENIAKYLFNEKIVSKETKLLICPQGEFTLYALKQLRRRIKLPYITWFMDDHLVRWGKQGWVYRHDHQDLMKEHLQQAEQVLVISPELKQFYHQQFGVDSQVLFAPCESLSQPIYQISPDRKKCHLAYFGSIGPWQQDALETLLPLINTSLINLDLYTNNQSQVTDKFQEAGAILQKSISPDQVNETMRKYDGVVLPISFREDLRHMSCFNIATKMAECLGSGVPTLVIGPDDAAMVKFLSPHNAAILVTNPNVNNLEDAVKCLMTKEERVKILDNAQHLVKRELCQDVMRKRWQTASSLFKIG